jgi:hypothetical protein
MPQNKETSALKCCLKFGFIFITYVLIALGKIFIWDDRIHHSSYSLNLAISVG